MAYSTLAYSPNEILTSAKMNQASDNDEALRDGTGILDNSILERHIPDSEIVSAKLAEAFIKGRRKNSTTNTIVGNYRLQMGWGYLPGDGTPGVNQTTVFPEAFSAPPLIIISYAGARLVSAGTPASLEDFNASVADSRRIAAAAIPTTSQFESSVIDAAGNTSNLVNYAYAWIAIGAA